MKVLVLALIVASLFAAGPSHAVNLTGQQKEDGINLIAHIF
uniref:Uncharacterized protein n=1 Tax=Nothobranchius kadleci TaxID=1051664 RepID=A0A1A8CL68_NOTKA